MATRLTSFRKRIELLEQAAEGERARNTNYRTADELRAVLSRRDFRAIGVLFDKYGTDLRPPVLKRLTDSELDTLAGIAARLAGIDPNVDDQVDDESTTQEGSPSQSR